MIWDYGLIQPTYLVPSGVIRPTPGYFFPFLDALGLDRFERQNYRTWRTPSFHSEVSQNWLFRDAPATLPGSANPDVSTWHQDGDPKSPLNWVACWANTSPTQFLLPSGTVVVPPDGHLMVIDNRVVRHRSGRDMTNRHFVRVIPPNDWTPQEVFQYVPYS